MIGKIFNFIAVTLTLLWCPAMAQIGRASPLSERQVRNLQDHPRQWDGKTVTIRIYPYDMGTERTFVVCFEICDAEYAQQSPYVIITSPNRFAGYRGNRSVNVTAHYDSSCLYKDVICADFGAGIFTEIER